MENYLEKLYGKVTDKLGSLASLAPLIAASLKKSISEGDIEAVRARTHELRELATAQVNLADTLDAAVADGSIDLVEGSEVAIALERVVDEAEDVIKGYDEDDIQP